MLAADLHPADDQGDRHERGHGHGRGDPAGHGRRGPRQVAVLNEMRGLLGACDGLAAHRREKLGEEVGGVVTDGCGDEDPDLALR
jgi:hypothetical protein